MLDDGLIEEVRALAKKFDQDTKPMQSIGYKQVFESLDQNINREELAFKITVATRQYAKRQETWFRKVEFDYYFENANQWLDLANFCRKSCTG